MAELTTKLKAERIQRTLEANAVHERLKAERIQERLASLPGWDAVRDGTALRRQVELPTIHAASLFASLAAEVGAAAGVSPTIRIQGREVTLTVATGRGAGLTDLDFDIAELLTLPATPGLGH